MFCLLFYAVTPGYNRTDIPKMEYILWRCCCIMDIYKLKHCSNKNAFLSAYNCCWRFSPSAPIFSFITLPPLISSLLIAHAHGKHDSHIHVHWIFKTFGNPNGERIFIPYYFEHGSWMVYGLFFCILIKLINYFCLKLLLCKLFWVHMFSTHFPQPSTVYGINETLYRFTIW